MKIILSRQVFLMACPCAKALMRYVANLNITRKDRWDFGKAIVEPDLATVIFRRTRHGDDRQELTVTATSDGLGGWVFQHTQPA